MPEKISLGVLEWGFREEMDPLSAVGAILDYAKLADELNYSRFWLTEHHNPNIRAPFSSPEILITLIAGMTNTIRVGSAGSMIRICDPFSLVTNFKLLSNLFSGRIDLGLSKGFPSSNYHTNLQAKDTFRVNTETIVSLFGNEVQNHQTLGVVFPPFGGEIPDIWFLSNSYRDFENIIKYKSNICRSLMHGVDPVKSTNYQKDQLSMYIDKYYSENGFYPKVCLALGVEFTNTPIIRTEAEKDNQNSIVPLEASYEGFCDLLYEYQDLYGVNEFIIYDLNGNNDKKKRNLEIVAKKMNLI